MTTDDLTATGTGEAPVHPPTSTAWPAPARVAAAGVGGFFGTSVVAGLLTPGYSPVGESLSALGAVDAPARVLMTAGFFSLAVGTVAAAVGLWVRLRSTVAGRAGAGLVGVAGAAMVVSGLARQDCSDAEAACLAREAAGTLSTHHWVHQDVSAAAFLLLAVALLVLPRGLRRNRAFAHMARPTLLTGVVALVAGVLVLGVLGPGGAAGVSQRALVAVLFGAPVLLAALPGRRDA